MTTKKILLIFALLFVGCAGPTILRGKKRTYETSIIYRPTHH